MLNFFQFTLSTVLGVVIAFLSIEYTDWRRRRSEQLKFKQHQKSIYTGLFTVRNFLCEQLSEENLTHEAAQAFVELKAAKDHLKYLIDKMDPQGEMLVHSTIEMSLYLEALLNAVETSPSDSYPIERRANRLIEAIDSFDMVARSTLTFLDEDYIEELISKKPAPTREFKE